MFGALYFGQEYLGFAQGDIPVKIPVVLTLACVQVNAGSPSCVVAVPQVVACERPAS